MMEKVYQLKHVQGSGDSTGAEGYLLPAELDSLIGKRFYITPQMDETEDAGKNICLLDEVLFQKEKDGLREAGKGKLTPGQMNKIMAFFLNRTIEIELGDVLYIPQAVLERAQIFMTEKGEACPYIMAEVEGAGQKTKLWPGNKRQEQRADG